MPKKTIGLVLSGGGARGAYQVGVLSAIADIITQENIQNNFEIISGVSAGAINAAYLASHSDDFPTAVKRLVDLWSQITAEKVFHTDAVNLGKIGFKWMSELSLGGLTGTRPGGALLDTAPLHDLISKNLNFSRIENNIEKNHLKALAITAVDYQTSNSITFIQGKDNLPSWQKARRRSERTTIQTEHIMASSAIPLLFPSVNVDDRHFGDGCVRNAHPCAASIYLGAEKLLVIGVRRQTPTAFELKDTDSKKPPSVARVLNTILNAVLLDGVELDIERLQRVNDFVSSITPEHRSNIRYKPVDFAWISPSADIGEIALSKSSRLPRIIRYLMKGLGSLEDASEVISYLLFDPAFCSQLIEIGYQDGMKQKQDIIDLLKD